MGKNTKKKRKMIAAGKTAAAYQILITKVK
jgi:hypothetical protein